ncbi:uncharacterized protein [Apostichopus japonicus]|uniref:uncharacterized protein n=1 Tax=Stichopus japonicus TaxID=307972 RepID=UPI003AB4F61F
MGRRFDISWSFIACCFVSFSYICANKPDIHRNNHQTNAQTRTALDEYIQRPDPSYCYRVLTRTIPTTNRAKHIDHNWIQKIANTYVINMTSQTWLTGDDVDKSVWWHYMTVSIPEVIRREDTALLLIQGEENTDNPPNPFTDRSIHHFAKLANKLQMVVATVYQIPNGPINFLVCRL